MKNKNALTIEQILKIIPHRQPFVLIDRVVEQSEPIDGSRVGRWVKAIKNVTYNEAFFAGHFPNRPIMPGVLIIESMAQAGMIACWRPSDPTMDVAIGRVSEFRIHRPVTPGDQLMIEAKVLKDRGNMVLMNIRSHVEEKLVTEFEILASMVPNTKGGEL